MAHVPVRRTAPRALQARPHRPLRRVPRGALVFGLLCAGVMLALYLNRGYAPGLRSEARSIPALVKRQLFAERAPYVTLAGISPAMRHAIVAIEDRRFYEHPGIDPVGTLRALWVNLWNKHVDQGGSTLEEQLVKRAIVHDDRTLPGKLRTMALAWAVDQDFSKQRILALYLNDAYYGQGAYGIGEASRIYFGTSPAALTVQQAAFLAALPQAPSIYGARPRSPQVITRFRTVLTDMKDMGYITAAQQQAAEQEPLVFALPNP